ncbi:helicase-related protein [uncultured Methylobacterium sp.]|uniref:helicase-related protein n=1 Tax=uncultured Methylobacterium sp. TaxID=157278 RepID=UPI0035CBD805
MSLGRYHDLIAAKRVAFEPRGFTDVGDGDLIDSLFDHQKHGVSFALRAGCAAAFYDTGLGKTALALAWGDAIVRRTNRPVLMLAPLAVAQQHVGEAHRLGVDAALSRFGIAPDRPRIAITNYERLERFDPGDYAGVILDESSILKSFTGATKRKLVEAFSQTPYRLPCSATPAPNDHTELGQHAEFLGVMRPPEMLSRWFIADQVNAGRYRLKKPAVRSFWDWTASWARCVARPSDLGFSDVGFEMPELQIRRHIVQADRGIDAGHERDGQARLFRIPNTSATSVHREKRLTKDDRAARVAEIVRAEPGEAWIVWVETDYDADAVREVLPEAIEVRGSLSIDVKEERLAAFSSGGTRILITKPSIAGYGLNWQHCARMAFMGLSFSYESFYQAVRRCWRFRQLRDVHAHVICADTEAAIWDVVARKSGDHAAMKVEMSAAMARAAQAHRVLESYRPDQGARLPAWMLP